MLRDPPCFFTLLKIKVPEMIHCVIEPGTQLLFPGSAMLHYRAAQAKKFPNINVAITWKDLSDHIFVLLSLVR